MRGSLEGLTRQKLYNYTALSLLANTDSVSFFFFFFFLVSFYSFPLPTLVLYLMTSFLDFTGALSFCIFFLICPIH